MSEGNFYFKEAIQKMEQVKYELPKVLANQAKNYFVDAWEAQGFAGHNWPEVERRKQGTKAYRYATPARRTEAILVDTGRLRRDVRNSIRTATFQLVELVVSTPYAFYHNEGTDKIPKRQFIGQSAELREKQIDLIEKFIDKIWPE